MGVVAGAVLYFSFPISAGAQAILPDDPAAPVLSPDGGPDTNAVPYPDQPIPPTDPAIVPDDPALSPQMTAPALDRGALADGLPPLPDDPAGLAQTPREGAEPQLPQSDPGALADGARGAVQSDAEESQPVTVPDVGAAVDSLPLALSPQTDMDVPAPPAGDVPLLHRVRNQFQGLWDAAQAGPFARFWPMLIPLFMGALVIAAWRAATGGMRHRASNPTVVVPAQAARFSAPSPDQNLWTRPEAPQKMQFSRVPPRPARQFPTENGQTETGPTETGQTAAGQTTGIEPTAIAADAAGAAPEIGAIDGPAMAPPPARDLPAPPANAAASHQMPPGAPAGNQAAGLSQPPAQSAAQTAPDIAPAPAAAAAPDTLPDTAPDAVQPPAADTLAAAAIAQKPARKPAKKAAPKAAQKDAQAKNLSRSGSGANSPESLTRAVRSGKSLHPGIDPPLKIDSIDPDEMLTILVSPETLTTAREISLARSRTTGLTRVLLGDHCIAIVGTGKAPRDGDEATSDIGAQDRTGPMISIDQIALVTLGASMDPLAVWGATPGNGAAAKSVHTVPPGQGRAAKSAAALPAKSDHALATSSALATPPIRPVHPIRPVRIKPRAAWPAP